MKGVLVIVGLLLVVAGTAVITHQGVTFYFTTQGQKVLDVGPFEASTKQATLSFYLTPVLGSAGLAIGVVLVFIGAYKTAKIAARKANQQTPDLSEGNPKDP